MYSNEEVKESEVIVPVSPFISNDIRLIKVEKTVNAEKDNEVYLDFTLQHVKTKGTLRDRIFEPKDKTDNPPFPDYSFEKERSTVLGRVKHFQGRFMSEDAAKATKGENWEQYVDAVVNSFPTGFENIPLDAKVVYTKSSNGKYYSSLPKFPPFLSSEKFPKSLAATGYDIYVMPAATGTQTAAPTAPVASASDEI